MGAPQFSINCGGSAGSALPAVLLADGTSAGPVGVATGTVELLTGAAIASASTINLDTATGNRVHITGTTTITTVTLTRGPRTVIFDGILTLTHNATTNSLPGGSNITTAAGDVAMYEGDGTTVYCTSYTKANGLAALTPPRVHVQEQQTSGTDSTSPNTASTWAARVLNTVVTNTAGASLASNQITLPAGTWNVWGRAPAKANDSSLSVVANKCRLLNVTDSSVVLIGSNATTGSASNSTAVSCDSQLLGSFTIAASKAFALQQWITGAVTAGPGAALSTGIAEVYAEIEFVKVG